MGSAPSRYQNTNWQEATGGLATNADTVDGSDPTAGHTQVTMTPKHTIPVVGQLPVVGELLRTHLTEYNVTKDGTTLYSTCKAPPNFALDKGFDLIQQDGTPILRIGSNSSKRTWNIYTIDKPVFEGQHFEPDAMTIEEGSDATTTTKLYRKAAVVFEKGTQHTAAVYSFGANEAGDALVLTVERCSNADNALLQPLPDRHWNFQSVVPLVADEAALAAQPAVGYWKWQTSNCIPLLPDDKIDMDLVQGSDLAMHILLAVVSTIERASLAAEYSG